MKQQKILVLDEGAGVQLLQVARQSLLSFVQYLEFYKMPLDDLPKSLRQRASSFVTLTKHGRLRGCIGSTQAHYPLVHDVVHNTAAASRDPRFLPVTAPELEDIRIEVTILQPPELLIYKDSADLLVKLRPGVHGVIISWQDRRALLLPQVWMRISDPAEFLQALCRKGDIPDRELKASPPTITVSTFQANSFEEDGYYLLS